jgi:putative tricarboxylic transport membrane protein
MTQQALNPWPQTLIGAGVLLTGLALGWRTDDSRCRRIRWRRAQLPALGLCRCPRLFAVHGSSGKPAPAVFVRWIPWWRRAYWAAFVWVSAGLLANAALITSIGFILSCTLCYVLAVQGLRRAAGEPSPVRRGPGV